MINWKMLVALSFIIGVSSCGDPTENSGKRTAAEHENNTAPQDPTGYNTVEPEDAGTRSGMTDTITGADNETGAAIGSEEETGTPTGTGAQADVDTTTGS